MTPDLQRELDRCDQIIEEIRNQPNVENQPAWWVCMGIADWETEKRLILRALSHS